MISKSRLGAVLSLGFLGFLAGIDSPTSSQQTQKALGWVPSHAPLLVDLEGGTYFNRS